MIHQTTTSRISGSHRAERPQNRRVHSNKKPTGLGARPNKLSATLFIFFGILLLAACSKEPGGGNPQPPVNAPTGVFVCNEGNFTYGNATLSFYDPATDHVTEPIPLYYNGYLFPLGDVCQSMYIRGDKGYIVVNNSSKIYVIDINTNAYLGKIDRLTSPRYIEFLSDTKAYVSDLYSPSITIINPTDLTITGYVNVGAGTEQTVRYGSIVFACSWSYNNKVYQIDTSTDRTVDSLTVTLQPNSMVLDRNGKLWILSDGGYEGSPLGKETPTLTRIDAATFAIEQAFPFSDPQATPTELSINGTGDRLYWLCSATDSDGVYSMPADTTSLPATPLIPEGTQLFYALGIDPSTSDIYVSDAIDYTQRGIIFRYDASGREVASFKAGIIPGSFCFKTGR